jgi:hypothetical protein
MIKMNRHIQYLLQTCVFLIGFLTLSQSQAQVAPILLFQDSIKPWNSMIHLQSEFNLGSNSVEAFLADIWRNNNSSVNCSA